MDRKFSREKIFLFNKLFRKIEYPDLKRVNLDLSAQLLPFPKFYLKQIIRFYFKSKTYNYRIFKEKQRRKSL